MWLYICAHGRTTMSSPASTSGKESTCNAGNTGLIPGSGRSPGGGHGNPLQYSCLGNPRDRGDRWATVHGVMKESGMTWWLDISKTMGLSVSLCIVFFFLILISRIYMRLFSRVLHSFLIYLIPNYSASFATVPRIVFLIFSAEILSSV